MELSERAITSLFGWTDPVGVLSIYAGVERQSQRPTSPIELRNQLSALSARLRKWLPHTGWRAFEERLAEIDAELTDLVDPHASGRGRALFTTVSGEQRAGVSLQVKMPTRVVFDARPYVRPLVAALEQGRPAGVIVLHQEGVRVSEWRLGQATLMESLSTPEPSPDWGPPPHEPPSGTPATERYETRLWALRERFLRAAANEIAALIARRRWDRLVIFGDGRLQGPLLAALPTQNQDVEVASDPSVPDDALASGRALMHLDELERRREAVLVHRVIDRGLNRNPGVALGFDPTLTALNEGRVMHLLFDGELHREGFKDDAGRLYLDRDDAMDETQSEPLLIERMIERVLRNGGRVTPVSSAAARDLDGYGGVAALLRA